MRGEGENRLGSRYVLDDLVGQGGMGVVWRGRDLRTGRSYAIKVLRPDLVGDPEVVGRFVRERAALMAVRHPSIVAVHDMVVEGDRLALVMDFVAGEDLRAYRLRRGHSLPPAEAAWATAQLCEALAAVHAAGIVHRDLKPANLLLDHARPGAPVRLADFGIARLLDDVAVTSSGSILGTPGYVAPEVLRGEPLGPACDVYAVGVILYELVTGSVPFTGPLAAVFNQHLTAPPPRDPKIPDALWHVIASCLAKDPAHRPAAGDLARVLGAAAGDPRAHRYLPPPAAVTAPAPATGPAPAQASASASASAWATAPDPLNRPPSGGATDHTRAMGPRRKRWPLVVGLPLAAVLVSAGVVIGAVHSSGTAHDLAAATSSRSPATTAPASPGASREPTPRPSATPSRHHQRPASTPTARRRTPVVTASRRASPSAKPRRSTASVTPRPTRSKISTAWRCGPEAKLGGDHPHTIRACLRTDGARLYLKGSFGPVPRNVDERVRLVLKTFDQRNFATFDSPACEAGVCVFQATAKPAHGTYRLLPEWLYDGEYQAAGRESPPVAF